MKIHNYNFINIQINLKQIKNVNFKLYILLFVNKKLTI